MSTVSSKTMSLFLKNAAVKSGITWVMMSGCFIIANVSLVTRRGLSLSATASNKQLSNRDALNMALDEELAHDERVSCSEILLKSSNNNVAYFRCLSWARRLLSMTELIK